MNRIYKILFVIILITQQSFAQKKTSYNSNLITKDTELNISQTKKRGIQSSEGIIFYIEKDLKTLTAIKNGKILWSRDILKVVMRLHVGKPEIRCLKLEEDIISIVFGKHTFVELKRENGKMMSVYAD